LKKLDILLLQAKLHFEHNNAKKKEPQTPGTKAPQVTARVAKLLNHNKELVRQVRADYWIKKLGQCARLPANNLPKPTVVPRVRVAAAAVQLFVRQRRMLRQQTTPKMLETFSISWGYFHVCMLSKSVMAASLRGVQRYLPYLGYKRGKQKGSLTYRLREENQRKRDLYLSDMADITAKRK
ncbi:hypothetical protein F443_14309, partial [Phytophthora nicotianae P1569]